VTGVQTCALPILIAISNAIFFGSLFLLPLFFEGVQHNTSLTTGELLIGQGLGTVVGIVLSGAAYNRIGPRILSVLGILLLMGSTYMLTQIDVNTTGQSLQVALVLRGLGAGIIVTPLQTLALSVVNNRALARASSLTNIMRQTVIALGVTGLTTYLVHQTTIHAADIQNSLQDGLRTRHFTGIAAICTQAAGPTLNLATIKDCAIQYPTTEGLTNTFWVTLIIFAACILLALIVGRDLTVAADKQAKGEKVEQEPQPALSE